MDESKMTQQQQMEELKPLSETLLEKEDKIFKILVYVGFLPLALLTFASFLKLIINIINILK